MSASETYYVFCWDIRLWSKRLPVVVLIESSDVVAAPAPPAEVAVPIDIMLVSILLSLLIQKKI